AALPAPSPAPSAAPNFAPKSEEKPRFGGLGSLINRMAGAPAQPGPLSEPSLGTAPRADAPMGGEGQDDGGRGEDQDRVEIPAFLRRQAN
ncbi:MAG: cell division protein FtsZ, partial [Lutimaribacter sp.]